jgi:hypothetical protein
MSDFLPPSCPETGQHIFGIATTKNNGDRPVRVEFFDEAIGFFHCVDVETGEKLVVFRQQIKLLPK